MGYLTDFYGRIHLFDKKAIKTIKELIKNGEYPFDSSEGRIEFGGNTLVINDNWKNRDEDIEKLCLFVAIIDEKAYGIIECSGEEAGDLWRIVVGKGEVLIELGRIVYSQELQSSHYKNIETKKQVYEITKDERLLRELILESLEDKE